MSVNCNLIMKNGNIYRTRHACFGFLGRASFAIYFLRSSMEDRIMYNEDRGITSSTPSSPPSSIFTKDIAKVEYVIDDCEINKFKEELNVSIFKKLAEMYDDLPMFGGIARVMPRNKVIRVTLGDNPADKVVFALMFGRMFAKQFSSEMLSSSFDKGLRHRELFISSMFYFNRHGNFWWQRSLEEGNLFDPDTFGINSLKDFMKQDESYHPWVQPPIKLGPYKREDVFQSGRVLFDPENRLTVDDVYHRSIVEFKCRKLTSCFSVLKDVQLIAGNLKVDAPLGALMLAGGISTSTIEAFFDSLKEMRV